MKQKVFTLFAAMLLSGLCSAQIVTNGLVGHWSFNSGDGTDALGANNASIYNGTTTTDRFGNAGKAIDLSCSASSFINLGTSATLKPQSATISIWVNVDTACYGGSGYSYNPVIITKNSTSSSFFEAYALYYNLNRQALAITTQPPANEKYIISSAQGVYDNWHHLVMSYDNDSLKLYFDGALQGTIYKGFTSVFQSGDSVLVGISDDFSNNRFLDGAVDDIRIYNRVLSAAEVDSLYNEANPVATQPSNGLLAYWAFNDNGLDHSGNGNHLSATGAVTYGDDRHNAASSALLLNGTDAFMKTTAPFYNAAQDQTISFWFKSNDAAQTRQTIFNSYPHRNAVFGYNWHGNDTYHFGLGDGNNWNVTTGPFGLDTFGVANDDAAVWNHTVITKNGLTWSFYLNDSLVKTFTYSNDPTSSLADMWIGSISYFSPSGSEFFNGYLDDFGIWNRVLTAQEITGLYTGIFTGLNEPEMVSNENFIQFFPNPSSGNLQFNANADVEEVEIFNLAGQRLQAIRLQGRQGSFELNLPAGMYLLRSRLHDGRQQTDKVILK